MRIFMSLGLVLVTGLAALAHSAPAALERIAVSGADYVRLEDWARVNRFQVKSTRQEVRLSNNEWSISFAPDSRRVLINDISVSLSAPITFRNGSTFVPQVDISTVLQPLLAPSRNAPGKKIVTVCIDPGHGGKDPGKCEGKQQEKNYTLLLAKELSAQLTKAGLKVYLTRTGDDFIDLPARPEKAKAKRADLFVSLHFNSMDGSPGGAAIKGTQIFCMTPARTSSTNARGEGGNSGAYPGNRTDSKNILLAYQVQKTLLKNLSVEDRGICRARYAVLRSAEMPSILIEGGFMSNKAEAKKIYDPVYRRQMAQAIAEGLLSYKRIVE
jgi:N-acetylmuramoyl-L-alanine amidase